MILREAEVKKGEGVSKNDAQTIVQRAMRFDSEILFEKGTRKINAKSLMGVISMGLKKGEKIMIIVKGDDEGAAMDDMAALFEKGFKI